jgi:hypothetical protein
MLAPVHDATDRGVRLGRDLDEIELLLAGPSKGLREGHDPDLGPVGVDKTHTWDLDLCVHTALLLVDARSLLVGAL